VNANEDNFKEECDENTNLARFAFLLLLHSYYYYYYSPS
jgi:hypothetical protein